MRKLPAMLATGALVCGNLAFVSKHAGAVPQDKLNTSGVIRGRS
jgi:hypothetical protein